MGNDDTYMNDSFYKEEDFNSGGDGVGSSLINLDEVEDEAEQAMVYSISADGFGEDSDEENTLPEESKGTKDSDTEESPREYSIAGDLELEDDDDDEETFSLDEKLRMFSDSVISGMLGNKSIRKYALSKLMTIASPRLFRDENHIIFSVLFNFRDRVKGLNIDAEFLRLYLTRNKGIVSKARQFIDIHAYEEIEGSLELGYISGVIKHFKRLSLMEDMTVEEYDTLFEKYLIEFKAVESSRIYSTAQLIVAEGVKLGNRLYSGFEDSQLYVRRELSALEGLTNINKGTGFTSMKDLIMGNRAEERKPIKIADFGKLAKLNEYYGGIYTGMFYQVMAPAKAGKSKFCGRICHTASVLFGTNVSVWAQEGGNEAWTAQQRAIHFDYTYNSDVNITERKFGINQDVIQKNNFPSEDLRDLELSSKMDLASNPEYGNVDFIDNPFNVETFIDSIDTSVKSNHSQLVIIDYLQLIMSENSSMSERERIAKAYTSLLNYCKKANVAILTPAQYKQEVINALMASKDTSNSELRTAGGNSAEVIRTPDITFAFWASTADLANNRMKVLSMPSRFAKPFPEIPCVIDLGCCQFISEQ